MKLTELLTEAVHRVEPGTLNKDNWSWSKPEKRGAPEEPARAFDKKGTDRSVMKKLNKIKRDREAYFATGDAENFGDSFSVHVMGPNSFDSRGRMKDGYHGISVEFNQDGSIEGNTFDKLADKEWAQDKQLIIDAAKKYFGKQIKKFLDGNESVGSYTTLPRFK